MSHEAHLTLPSGLQSLATMASLLERLDREPRQASADQYRAVARQVRDLLAVAEPGVHLQGLLRAAPATSEVYENLRYDMAGLCRAPLNLALDAEVAAAAAIAKARALR